jgi:hypothetical protein
MCDQGLYPNLNSIRGAFEGDPENLPTVAHYIVQYIENLLVSAVCHGWISVRPVKK